MTAGGPGRRRPQLSPRERMETSALRILALRAHTRAELRRKLLSRDFDADEVETLLDRLIRLGYLDDAAAARSWIRRRSEDRPMGRRMLERELRQRGVTESVRRAALDEAYGERDELTRALEAGGKRLRSLRPGEDPRARERLLRFLKGRGFPASVCLEAAETLLGGVKEAEEENFLEAPPEFPEWKED